MALFVFLFGILFLLLFLFVAWISATEREMRATLMFAGVAFFVAAIFIIIPVVLPSAIIFLFYSVLILVTILLILILPIDTAKEKDALPKGRFDERDTMFSRNELIEGTENFRSYYKNHPKKKQIDDRFRSKPGLLAKESLYYDPEIFAAARVAFFTVEQFKNAVNGNISEDPFICTPAEFSQIILKKAINSGAVEAAICEMKDYHWYSHKGRGEEYGNKIEAEHRYGIAILVEMDKSSVDEAPKASIVMESARQYLESGKIATQLAAYIRNMGYEARAHIDGNYRLICPLVARDAGLGEIGRMGLLMSKKFGPRVRIAVVTTNAPMQVSERKYDPSVIHFCHICKKCADICPSKAIPFGNKKNLNGVSRWQINSEACFTYWCIAGTDCGQCMKVCPYSHPDNLMHNMIRKLMRKSVLFRYFALSMDKFVYGK